MIMSMAHSPSYFIDIIRHSNENQNVLICFSKVEFQHNIITDSIYEYELERDRRGDAWMDERLLRNQFWFIHVYNNAVIITDRHAQHIFYIQSSGLCKKKCLQRLWGVIVKIKTASVTVVRPCFQTEAETHDLWLWLKSKCVALHIIPQPCSGVSVDAEYQNIS